MLVLLGVSGTAFAGNVVGYQTDSLTLGATAGYQLVVKTSKNVAMRIDISTVADVTKDPAVNYVMGAYHGTGSRTFATSNQDQKLYYQDTTGVVPPDVPTSTTTLPSWGTSWLPL